MQTQRRFAKKEIEKGPFKGALHVPTERYYRFAAEIAYLADYLQRRFLPNEPEEFHIRNILIDLLNLIESLLERVILEFIKRHPGSKNEHFRDLIKEDEVSFKTKCEWSIKRKLISETNFEQMNELRLLRNAYAHMGIDSKRMRVRYRGVPLLTLKALRQLFKDMERIRTALCVRLNEKKVWPFIPPGYVEEMRW